MIPDPSNSSTTVLVLTVCLGLMLIYTFAEFIYLAFITKRSPYRSDFLQPLKNMGAMAPLALLFSRLAPLITIAALGGLGAQLSAWQLPDAWYSWALALVIYEFWYWVQHWLAHKVRLLWCIHSPHHAPNTINMLVGTNHHVVEALVYFPFFFGFLPALCGVPVEMLIVINLIDTVWGSLLHISPNMVRRRYGVLEYVLQTPSYHRAHHAKNIRYLDSNYNSITLLWDWLLGTREPLSDEEPVRYGITRAVNVESWWDVQWGEFKALSADMASAPGVFNKMSYAIMPPGWSHTGDHKTVSVQKKQLCKAQKRS